MATLLIPTDTSQATLGFLLADGTIVGSTSQAQDFGSTGITTDVIAESTSAAGVTISDEIAVAGASILAGVAINLTGISGSDIIVGVQTGHVYTGSGANVPHGFSGTVTHEGTVGASSLVVGVKGVGIANRSSGGKGEPIGGQFSAATGASQDQGVDEAIGIQLNTPTYDADGDKPTLSMALQIEDWGNASSTTGIALNIESQTASGTNTYQIKEDSTTGFNVLAGNTRIGATTDPTVALDVTGAALISTTLDVTGALTAASYGGITEANLLDKTATESISGAYTHTVGMIVDGSADEIQLTVQGNATQTTDILVVESSNGADLFVIDSDGDAELRKHVSMGSGGTISTGRVLNLLENLADANAIGARMQATNTSTSGLGRNTTGLAGVGEWKGTSTSTGGECTGLDFIASHNSTLTLSELTGVKALLRSLSGATGAIGTGRGIHIPAPTWTGDTPLEVIGIDIEDLAAQNNTFGIRIKEQTAAGTATNPILQEGTVGENILNAPTIVQDRDVLRYAYSVM